MAQQVRVAEDTGQAVEMLSMWRPHFIWMDVHLPVLGGMKAAKPIRDREGGREVKIAAVTASAFSSQREEVIAAGFDDFLRKPYRSREIFDCMGLHLGIRYVYRAGPKAAVSEPLSTLHPEDFAVLPAALREELENAVISLDSARIALLIGHVSKQNASLGSVLGIWPINLPSPRSYRRSEVPEVRPRKQAYNGLVSKQSAAADAADGDFGSDASLRSIP